MAQADEMGEGEGRDDGFVDSLDPISRRRSKKRAGGVGVARKWLSEGIQIIFSLGDFELCNLVG